jgi:hypothetical protein
MLLDPFLYDFVADHQRALREAAERGRCGGEGALGWSRLALGMSAATEARRVPSAASRRLVCRRLRGCRHAGGHVLVGPDV